MNIKNLLMYSAIAGLFLMSSCADEVSTTTGWNYNDSKNGGYQKYDDFYEQETGPGLVLVEGGSFTMGAVQQDVMYDWNNVARKVSVSSFYMDETEVRNLDYREYLYWTTRVFAEEPSVYWAALPDTLVWRSKLSYNEPYVQHYLRHPAFQNYPVVGVSWLQANDYCVWRTDRVNERILIREGILNENPDQIGADNFNVETYMKQLYEGSVNQNLHDYNPSNGDGTRIVREEDGIILPKYRLPTEAEWEFAALSIVGSSVGERVYERKIYPWAGDGFRNPAAKERGRIMANAMRGRGDMMGVAGALNDNADITAPVFSYWPNDYGLYCMAGNVNEWVADVYRTLSADDVEEFRPFRGNVFQTLVRDEEGNVAEKDSLGHLRYRNVSEEEAIDRRNYQTADNINYLDGDFESSLDYSNEDASREPGSKRMYYTGKDRLDNMMTSLVSDHVRVYKGGGWHDRIYWLGAGTRRFLDENQAQDDLGFRCAMTRVGDSKGN